MGFMDKVKAQAEVGDGQGQRPDQGRPGEAGPGLGQTQGRRSCSTTSARPSTSSGSVAAPTRRRLTSSVS